MSSVAQSASTGLLVSPLEDVLPIFYFVLTDEKDGMLWSAPKEMSQLIYDNTLRVQKRSCVCRLQRNEEIQTYKFDVEKMEFENTDDYHDGKMLFAWVKREQLTPSFTGETSTSTRTKENRQQGSRRCLACD